MKLIALIFLTFTLLYAACAQAMLQPADTRTQPFSEPDLAFKKRQQLKAALDIWQGTDFNRLALIWGAPQKSIALPNDGAMYTYVNAARNDSPQAGCITNVIVDKNVVVGFKSRGC